MGPVLIISLMQCQSMKAISIYIHNAYRFCTLHVRCMYVDLYVYVFCNKFDNVMQDFLSQVEHQTGLAL